MILELVVISCVDTSSHAQALTHQIEVQEDILTLFHTIFAVLNFNHGTFDLAMSSLFKKKQFLVSTTVYI